MSIILQDTGLDLEARATFFLFNASTQPVYANFFNDADKLTRNLCLGTDIVPTLIGEPTHSGQYAGVGNGVGINTAAPHPTGDFTLIAVHQAMADANEFPITNYSGGTSAGLSIYANSITGGDGNVRYQFTTAQDNAGIISLHNTQISTNVAVPGSPAMIVARYTASTRYKRIDNLTAGTANASTPTYPLAAGGSTLRIGEDPASIAAATRVYCAAIWDVALSDAEVAAVYAQLQAHYAGKSITI